MFINPDHLGINGTLMFEDDDSRRLEQTRLLFFNNLM
jgi:hypothetical protein